MNNYVDSVFNTDATGGVLKFRITHADSTTEDVQIDIITPVQVLGTEQNKVFFDSIRTDLTNLSNNKLNVSAKATTAQAQAGTNDTNYLTPKKLRDGVGALLTEVSVTGNATIFDFASATGNIVEIQGTCGASSGSANLVVAGNLKNQNGETVSTIKVPYGSSVFYLRFDLLSKTIVGTIHYVTGSTSYTNHYDWVSGTFTTPSISMSGTTAQCHCTVLQNV